MKKAAKIGIPIILAVLLCFLGSFLFKDATYEIDTSKFESTVAYQEEVDLSGLRIVQKRAGLETFINVDESMVTECDPTSSVGDKSMTVTYNEQVFTVNFTVKYRVEFLSDADVISTQYVLKANEINLPSDPYKKGFEFDGWSPKVPDAINDNLVFEAIFRDTPKEVPNLGSYNAVYSDTLADISLPSNQYGAWKFIDSLETPVGNVGSQSFNVQFIPTNPELTVLKDVITVYVSKMKLNFNFTRTQFDYDGLEHKPEYTLIDTKGKEVTLPANEVQYSGQIGKEVGSYLYAFTINSANYEGNAMGYFSISTNKVIITIHDKEIDLGDNLPEFTFDVEGVYPETIPLLNIQIIAPKVNNAGEYEISAVVNNPNYTDVEIRKGTLKVNKITLGATDLTIISNPVYGDKLSDIIIADDNPNGYWKWVDGNVVLNKAGNFDVEAVFIPYSSNYNEEYRTVTIPVAKKTLEITVVEYEYIYDGTEKTIVYTVDGFVLGDTIADITVDGNVTQINAKNYSTELKVVADNYDGITPATLAIKKATPVADFTKVFDNILLNTKLSQIELPKGYTWDIVSTELDTVGEGQLFPATYTHDDAANYEQVKGFFTVNVIKHTAKITARDTYLFTYNGEVHTLTNVTASHTESTLEYQYFLNGVEVENIRNAGTYRVLITLPESHTYYETTLEVTAIVDTIGVSPEPSVYDATYGDKLGSITLPTSEYGVWSWKDAEDGTPGEDILVGNGGNRIHTAVFTSNNPNYKSYEVNVTIVVAKKKINIIVDENDNIHNYDGNSHKVVYSIENDIDVKVVGNTPYTDAGRYSITLIIDDINYEGSITTPLVINSIDPSVESPVLGTNGEILWNTNAFDYNALLPAGFAFKENYLFDTVGEDLEYKLIYTPSNTNNYNTIEVTAYITVSPIDATITYRETTYTYNGNRITLNASTNNNDAGVALQYVYKLNGVEVSEIKDAGTYSVDIISPASTNYNKTVKTVTVVVNKAAATVIWEVAPSYTYSVNGQTLPEAEFVDVFGQYNKLDVVFVDTLNSANTSFKNASTYVFSAVISAELSKNYTFDNVDSDEVVINKATVDTSNAIWSGSSFVFDGNTHTVQINNVAWPSDVTVNYEENSAKDAGDYEAKVTIIYDANNYNTIEVEEPIHNWSISASGLQVKWEDNDERTYTSAEFDLPKAYIYDANIDSKIYLDVDMDKATFKDAGLYTFVATETSGNYELIGAETTVLVKEATLTVEWTIGSYTYTGSELTKPTAKVVDLQENEVNLTVTISSGNAVFKNAGDYYFLAAFGDYAEKTNYVLSNDTSAKVSVAKANYVMSGAHWDYDGDLVYTSSEQSVEVVGLPAGVTVLSYLGNTGTNASTYTASVTLSYDEENYNEPTIEDLDWEIKAKEIAVVWADNENREYTGNQFSLPSASFVDLKGNEVTVDNGLLFVRETSNAIFKDAGVYTFKAEFSNSYVDKANYIITNTANVTVTRKDISEDSSQEELEATYGDELGDVTLPEPAYGTWTFSSDHEVTDKVGNVGTYTVYLDFTPNAGYEQNYDPLTRVAFTLKVSAYATTVSITPNGGTYAGTIVGATAVVNSYVDAIAPAVTLTYTGTANDGTVYNSTTVPTLAGTYTVTATIADANYSLGATSTSFTVAKATPEFITTTFDADWNTKLADIDLSTVANDVAGTYTFDVPDTTLENVGNGQQFNATFTPNDLNNYEIATGKFTVNVSVVAATITANDTYTFTYDGNAKTVTATGSHTESTLQYVYKLNGVEVGSMVNAGTYSVEITLPATEHYAIATKTVSVTINKKSVDVYWDIAGSYTYSVNGQETPKAYIQLIDTSWSEINVAESNGKTFKDAGAYSFEASLTGLDVDENYVLGNNIVSSTIQVGKATIDLSASKWNYTSAYTYNGASQGVSVIGVSLPSDVTIAYSGNAGTNATSYNATASLTYNSNNYDVTGSLPGALAWSIAPKDAVVKWEDADDREYTSEVFDAPTAYIDGVSGRVDLTVEMLTTGTYKNVGTYDFVASDASGNYNLSNEDKSITVNAKTLTVEWTVGSYTYTGSELTKPTAKVVDLQENEVNLTVTISSGNAVFKNAGDYYFLAAFGDYAEKTNYVLSNDTSAKVSVAKANYVMSGAHWDYDGDLVYTSSEQSVEVVGLPAGVTVLSYLGNTGTNASTYTASVTLSYDEENYNEPTIEDLDWEIKAKEIEVVWSEEVYEYTGSNLSYPTASYTGLVISVSKDFDGEFKNAGSYQFKATIANTNYEIINPTKVYEVSKKNVSDEPVNREVLEATYGDELGDVTLPTSTYGIWSLSSDHEVTDKVGNVGTHIIYLDFAPHSQYAANYDPQTRVEYSLEVSAYATTVSITPNGGTYAGTIVGATAVVNSYVDAIAPAVTLTYTGTANDGTVYNSTTVPTLAGTYTVTATIADTNYSLGATSTSFVVARKDASITNTLAASTDYNGSAVDITNYFELSHNEVELSYSYKLNGATVSGIKDAGIYTVVVSAAQSANYNAISTSELTYTVNKITPNLSYNGQTSFTYSSGATHSINSANIIHENTDTGYVINTVIKLNGETVDVIDVAGTYSVTITITSTTNFLDDTYEFDVTVAKGSIDPGSINTSHNATYGQTLGDFDLPAATVDGSWSWQEGNSTPVGDVGTRVHKAVYTPTDTSLEEEVRDITFNVSAKEITFEITSETSFVYDKSAKTITYTLSETPAGVEVDVTGTVSATVVGNYSVTFTIIGNDNYTGTRTVAWSITKATPTYTTPTGLEATYGDKLSSVSLSAFNSINGSWSWEDTNAETTVGNAGTRTHNAVFTPVDEDNYVVVTIPVSITVAKQEYTPTVSATAAEATYGDTLSQVTVEGSNSMGKWVWTNPTEKVGNVGTNDKSVTFSLNDPNNYYVASASIASVKVNPKDVTVSITPNGGTYAGTIVGATAQVNGHVDVVAPAVTLTYTGTANDGTEYNSTTVPTLAGTYTVTATIADSNYNLTGNKSTSFVVKKAKPAGTFNVSETTFEWGKILGDLGLDFDTTVEGISTWDDGDAYKPGITLGSPYAVTFTPTDVNNYEVVTSSITLVVNKVTTSISTSSNSYEFTYGDFDNFLAQLGAELNPDNEEQEIKFYDGVNEVTTIQNAGSYTIVIMVEESAHYKESSKEVTIEVAKKEEEIILETNYEYGSTMDDVDPELSEYGEHFVHETDPNAQQVMMLSTRSISSQLLGVAGSTKTVWVEFIPYPQYENNYARHIKEIVLSIVQKKVTVNITPNGGEYNNIVAATASLEGILDGEVAPEITLTYTGTANDGTVYDGTAVPTLAGNYEVTASIEAANYVLSGTVSADFVVEKASPVYDAHTFEAYWNEKTSDYELTSMVARDPNTNDVLAGSFAWNGVHTFETVGDGQVFYATFTPADQNNYKVVDNVEFNVDVNRIETTVTVTGLNDLVYAQNQKVYVNPIVNHSEVAPVISIVYQNGDPAEFLSIAGTYTITITIAETAHYTAYNGTPFEVVVEKATPSTDFSGIKEVTWNENLKLKDVTLAPGYTWDNPNSDLDDIGIASYPVTYTPNDTVNYKTVNGEVQVKVNKADGEVSANNSYEFVYKHEEYTVNDLTNIIKNHSESELVIDKVLLNAGEYSVTITLPASTHYNEATTTTIVVIKKAVEAQPGNLTASYGTELGNVTLPTSTNGTWSVKESVNESTTVYNAGEHDITLTFTAATENYETRDYIVKLVVSPVAYPYEIEVPTGVTSTYGNKLSSVSLTAYNVAGGTWSWKDTNENTLVGQAGDRTHVAIFTPTSANYVSSEHEVTITVAKKTLTFINVVDTFNFNESTHYVTYELEGILLGDQQPDVTGNDGLRNVGSEVYELIVDDANYQGSYAGTIKVNPVDPETNFAAVVVQGTYGKPLSSIDLSSFPGYSFAQPATIMQEVGNGQTFAAKYTHPTEGANYNTVNGVITVNVVKANYDLSQVEWNYEEPFTYNGEVKSVELTNLPAGITIVSYENNEKTAAGDYQATVKEFTYDSEHYNEPEFAPLNWSISKASVDVVLQSEYQYGTTLADVKPQESIYGTFTVTHTDTNYVPGTVLGNANAKVRLIVSFASNNANYASFEEEVEIEIVRAEVRFENVVGVYTYDGNPHTVTYTLANVVSGDNPTVTGNASIITVSESTTVTLVIDEANYYGSLTTELTIKKATPATNFSTVYTAEYNTKLSAIVLPEGYSWVNDKLSLTTVADGQKFAAVYIPADETNYERVNGEFTVNVTKINSTVTINSSEWSGKTYAEGVYYDVTATVSSGAEANITVGYNSSTTASESDQYDELGSGTGVVLDKLGNAGTYKITVTAAETNTYNAISKTYYVVIAQKSIASFTKTYSVSWKDGLTLANSGITLDSGYAWNDSSLALTEIKDYYANATFTPGDTINYLTETGSFKVTVNKANATITADTGYELGKYRDEGYTVNDLRNVQASHTESNPTIDVTLKDAKEYEVTITLPESAHYNKATCVITVTIGKKTLDLPTGLTATYGDTLEDVTLPTSSYGTWNWVEAASTPVGDAGNRVHAVIFTPTNTNYAERSGNVTIVVSKQKTNVTANIPANLVYKNGNYDYTTWFTTNSTAQIGYTITKDEVTTSNVNEAGSYTIDININESTNFTSYVGNYSFIVTKAPYSVTSTPTASTATYGDTLSTVTLTGGDATGTWAWVSPTDLVGNAGTRTHNAVFTPTNHNYATSTHSISVTVNKKPVTIVVLDEQGNPIDGNDVSYTYSGSTQYILYEIRDAQDNKVTGITLDGNNGWKSVSDSGTYELSLNHDNYTAENVSGNVFILQATPTLNLPTFEDETFYEDRMVDINLTQRATAKNIKTNKVVEGTFSYNNPEFTSGAATSQVVNVIVTFTPKDSVNYATVEGNIVVTLLPVAYIDSTYYGTVEKALEAAVSGKIVYVIVGANPIIRDSENAIINSGVTLFLPHTTGVTTNYTKAQCPYHVNTTKCGALLGAIGGKTCGNALYTTYTDNLTLTMTIEENVTLTNNGTLEIGGNLSGGGGGSDAVGHTVGNYAQIILKSGAKIESTGDVKAFGYIKQESADNGSEVIMNSGTIGMPFILRDFKGGSQTYGIYSTFGEKHYAAFEQYEMRNVQTKLTVKYNANVDGWANIYAGEQQNDTIINLVGKDSGNLIQFTTEYSYLVSTGEFITIDTFNNALSEASTFDPIQRQVYKLNINLYGGAQTNAMSLKIKVLTSNVNVSTQDVYFGIPYSATVTLNKAPEQSETAVYTMAQRFKLMTGSSFVVSEGAKLIASDFFVYSKYDYDVTGITSNFMARYYPSGLEPAQFIVSGTVEATNFAGPVLLQKGKGSITVSGSSTMTISTAKTHNGESATSNAVSTWFEDTETLSTKEFVKINKVVDDEVETIEFLLENGTYIPSDISKPGYTFNGWYIGDTLWSTLYPTGINEDATLEARFTLNTYDINYNMYNYQAGSSGTNEAVVDYNETLDSFTVEDGLIRFDTPTHSEGHTLKGLYINSTSGEAIPLVNIDGQRVYAIEVEDLYNYLENGAITVYAVWYQNPLTIEFVNTNYDQQVLDLYHWSIEQNNAGGGTIQIPSTLSEVNSYTFPSFDTYNDDETYDKFFIGWRYNGNPINNFSFTQEQLNEIMNTSEKKVVLEAVWEDKVTINIGTGDNAPKEYTFRSGNVNCLYNHKIYVHETKINEISFEEEIDFYSGNADQNNPIYFAGWYCNGKPLQSKILDSNLIEDGEVNIYGLWINKNVLDIKLIASDKNEVVDSQYYIPYDNEYGIKVNFVIPDLNAYLIEDWEYYVTYDINKNSLIKTLVSENSTDSGQTIESNKAIPIYKATELDVNLSKLVKVSLSGNTVNFTLTLKSGIIYNTSKEEQSGTTFTTKTHYMIQGSTFTVSVTPVNNYKDAKISSVTGATEVNGIYTVSTNDVTIKGEATYDGGCFAEGTLITLADGSTKKVEELTTDDYVLGWDFEKGTYVSVPILLNAYHGTYETNIINLVFEDGTVVRMILEHGFFDITINEWVYIDESNYISFIGHTFATKDDLLDSYSTLKLVDAYITNEKVGVYGPVAAYTINCYAEGVLSIVPATGITSKSLNGLFQYFEIGNNLQYDLEAMEEDINKYGLYSYDEFKEYATEYEFNALNMKYLRVSVGKGYITEEEIILALKTYFPKN